MPDCLCAVILLPVTLPMPIGKYQHQVQRYRPKQAANKWKPEANAAAASAISPEEKDLLHALRAQHGAYPRVQDPRRAHEANIVDRVTENAGRTEQLLARQEALRNIDAGTPLMFGNAPLATKLILGGLLLHSVSSTAAHVNLHSRLLADHGRSIAPSAEPGQTPGASDTGSDEAPDEQTAGTSVPESQSTNVQQFKPAHFEQALQAPANATTANSEQVRSKRESSPSAGKLSIPLPWGSKRPSSFSQHMLGEAPTREIVYRMAIKLNGQDPDQKYVLTDRWQTFSQNMLTANLRVNQTKTHVELALDADTEMLPFLVRRYPENLYWPKEALFKEAYDAHIQESKERGIRALNTALADHGIERDTKIDLMTVSAHNSNADPIDKLRPQKGDRGFIVALHGDSGTRYFALTPLDDDMVFPISKTVDLYRWISENRYLFFTPDMNFDGIDSFYARGTMHDVTAGAAVDKIVPDLVDRIIVPLKRLAYGETQLQEFIHLARGMIDPGSFYDLNRALELEDYTTFFLTIGASLIPVVRGKGVVFFKYITKHSKGLKNFLKNRFIKNGIGDMADLSDDVVQTALTFRSLQALDHGSTPDDKLPPLSANAKNDLTKINELITKDNWIRNSVIEEQVATSSQAISRIRHTLADGGYKTEVICMLVWRAESDHPKVQYLVTVRRFGDSQEFVIDAPIGDSHHLRPAGTAVYSLQKWGSRTRKHAEHNIPHGRVKIKLFSTTQAALDAFKPGQEVAQDADLGANVLVLHEPNNHHGRGHRHHRHQN